VRIMAIGAGEGHVGAFNRDMLMTLSTQSVGTGCRLDLTCLLVEPGDPGRHDTVIDRMTLFTIDRV